MPSKTLFPYSPTKALETRLAACGFDAKNPAIATTTTNLEAERLLPRNVPPKRRLLAGVAAIAFGAALLWPVPAEPQEIIPPPPFETGTYPEIDPESGPLTRLLKERPITSDPENTDDTQPFWQSIEPYYGPTLQGLTGIGVYLILATLLFRNRRKSAAAVEIARPESTSDLKDTPVPTTIEEATDSEENGQEIEVKEPDDLLGAVVTVGGASRTGLVREENQDAFRTGKISDGLGFIVVCDGVGGQPGGKEAAECAARHILAFLTEQLASGLASPGLCEEAIASAQIRFADKKLIGLTTAIVAILDGCWIHYATLGDGALSLIHEDGMVQELLAPHHVIGGPSNIITAFLSAEESFVPHIGSVRVETGSTVLAMSDGASDILNLDELATARHGVRGFARKAGVDAVAENLALQIESLRDEKTGAILHSDNMTIAIGLVDNNEEDA